MRYVILLWLVLTPAVVWAEGEEAAAPEEEVAVEADAEAQTEVREIDPLIFETALDDYYNERYPEAAAGFWGYIHFGDATAENFEWAQYFLAESLAQLGFWHAAVNYYYIVAKTRSRPEILPEALARLEVISRRRPFSEDLVYEDLLYDSDFGALPSNLSHWVNYVQGLYDTKNTLLRWSNRHFESIPKDSVYALRALYVQAVFALKKKQDDRAVALLSEIIDSKVDDAETKNKANLALARLLYDLGSFAEAQAVYDRVQQIDLSYEQAQLLLEKAWTAYQLKDTRKAMGLLHALEAPSYQRFFLADAYVLRGVIMKDMCHFIGAKRVVRAFRFKYQRALDDLHKRLPATKIPAVLDGATQEGTIARRTAFIRTLTAERKMIDQWDSKWEDVELDKHLVSLYDAELKEQGRKWRLAFEGTAHEVANGLLATEEQVNLLDYEVGLDIFKRLKATSAKQSKEQPLVIPYDSSNVYYEFDTEFWNDELHSYQYFIASRCFESEERSE